MQMHIFRACFILVSFFTASAFAQETTPAPSLKLEGIWKWTFTMPDGTQVTPRLELREEAGQLTGNTRIRAGSEAPITNLTIKGSEITFEVIRENEDREVITRYTGIVSTNTIKGKIISNWS